MPEDFLLLLNLAKKSKEFFAPKKSAPVKPLRKEVIHPQLRLGIPCYDLSLIADFGFVPILHRDLGRRRLCCLDGRCVQDPRTYSPRPADSRLLAIPTSWGRVADPNLN
jgi:hypothetical protein